MLNSIIAILILLLNIVLYLAYVKLYNSYSYLIINSSLFRICLTIKVSVILLLKIVLYLEYVTICSYCYHIIKYSSLFRIC